MHPPGLLRLGDGLVAEMGGGLVARARGHPARSFGRLPPLLIRQVGRSCNRGRGEGTCRNCRRWRRCAAASSRCSPGRRHRARRGPPARPALAVPAAAGRAADRPRGSTALRRRSKYLLADLDGGETLIVHLGMSGRLLVSGAQLGAFHHAHPAPEKHDHVVLDVEGGARITFNDARRFGAMDLWPTRRARGAPAARRARARAARQRLRRRLPRRAPRRPRGPRSRRCSATSGWSRASATSTSARRSGGRGSPRSGSPRDVTAGRGRGAGRGGPRRARRRHRRRRLVACATTASADGELGYFQHSFAVYDREGEPCPRCGGDDRAESCRRAGRASSVPGLPDLTPGR